MGASHLQLLILTQENLLALIKTMYSEVPKKYVESGAIGRQEGSSGNSKIIADIRRLVDEKMMEDDETKTKEQNKMLAEHGHHVDDATALKCQT